MTTAFGFNMPDGARISGMRGSEVDLQVSMPADDDGYIGRACPSCLSAFRIQVEDYHALRDNQRLFCAYCGHEGDPGQFTTTQQRERAMSATRSFAQQYVAKELDDLFGGMARRSSSRSSAVRFEYRPAARPRPEALPDIAEEAIIRERACETCGIRYAVFGEHTFCPTHGPLSPDLVALDALVNQQSLVALVDSLPAEKVRVLREQGAFDRLAADAVKAVATILETFLGATFRAGVPDADAVLRGKGNVFQRIDDAADLFGQHLSIELRALAGQERWDRLGVTYAERHVLVHQNGSVDQRFLQRVADTRLRVGQRLVVTRGSALAALEDAEQIIKSVRAEHVKAPPPR